VRQGHGIAERGTDKAPPGVVVNAERIVLDRQDERGLKFIAMSDHGAICDGNRARQVRNRIPAPGRQTGSERYRGSEECEQDG
jgi:hypothetical protein